MLGDMKMKLFAIFLMGCSFCAWAEADENKPLLVAAKKSSVKVQVVSGGRHIKLPVDDADLFEEDAGPADSSSALLQKDNDLFEAY